MSQDANSHSHEKNHAQKHDSKYFPNRLKDYLYLYHAMVYNNIILNKL